MRSIDITGMVFGRLTVLYRHQNDYITPSTGKRMSLWVCRCICGNTTIVSLSGLRSGKTKSCGCLQRERTAQANTKHGGRYDRLHTMWANMKNRCFNPNYAEFKDYGGRGIKVCKEWMEYPGFKKWAISAGYNDSLQRGKQTLDRIDSNSDYCPENCRFADMYVQANNKHNNIRYELDGIEHTLAEWSSIFNIPYDYLYYRVRTKGLELSDVIMAM